MTLGILGAIGAGLVGSPHTSALNASSLNRFCGDASSITLGHFTLNCPIEQSFLDSIIPTNLAPGSEDGHEVSYNILDDMDGWGYDGKGVVFTGSNNLVPDKDGNPNQQMRTAKRGDRVGVSIKGVPGHNLSYPLDPSAQLPIFWYELRAELSQGLVPDERSIQIKVDDVVLDPSLYTLSVEDPGDSTAEGIGYVIAVKLEWAEYTKPTPNPEKWEFVRHLYEEDAEVELSFSVAVDQSAPSTAAITATLARRHAVAGRAGSAKSPATILIDGNLVIQRTDESGEPLAGASYSIAGLKATKDTLNENVFHYDENGDIESFTTDEAGKIVILGVPLGKYSVTETETPEGHTIKQDTQQIEVNWLSSSLEQYDSVVFEGLGMGNDFAKYITRLADGSYVLSPAAYEAGQNQLPYDSASGSYTGWVDLPFSKGSIVRDGDKLSWKQTNGEMQLSGEFTFNDRLGKYTASWIHMPLGGTLSADIAITEENGVLTVSDSSIFEDIPLKYDSSDGCYHYSRVLDGTTAEYVVCKEDGGYIAKMVADYSALLGEGSILVLIEYFHYDETTGLYVSNGGIPVAQMVVDEITPEYVTITGYPLLRYSSSLDLYYVPTLLSRRSLKLGTAFRKTIQPTEAYGTNILFSEMADNVKPADAPENIPEGVPNPQTSDTLTKVAFIILITTASAFVITRKLSRR